MTKKILFILLAVTCLVSADADGKEGNGCKFVIKVEAMMAGHEISPYIYGSNVIRGISHRKNDLSTLVRLGGNRSTGFNWETNASNSGRDWHHGSDDYMAERVVEGSQGDVSGSVVATFVRNCIKRGQTPMVTIPICHYVAADKNGEVAPGDSSRWVKNIAAKSSPFSLLPDTTDRAVYADECVNFLTDVAGGKGRIIYGLDNEPSLWHRTHPRLCPEQITCKEFMMRTINFARAIKKVDSEAIVAGFVSFGYTGFNTFNGASDWDSIKATNGYDWFLDYFLDEISKTMDPDGHRAVDVLDIHWYPEARGDKRIIDDDADSPADRDARLQAPRSLWDSTFKEKSWITSMPVYYLPLLPKVKASIDRYCPGLKLAFTEFKYGGDNDISGAIALADVLGLFGRNDIYAACHWSSTEAFGNAAYKLYLDYDGQGASFGSYVLECRSDMPSAVGSVYASASDKDCSDIHIMLINKSELEEISGHFVINSAASFDKAVVYYVTGDSPEIEWANVSISSDNTFSYSLPPLSVAHIVATPMR